MCTLRGGFDATFCLVCRKGGEFVLQRLRGGGILVFEVPLFVRATAGYVLGAVDTETNELAFLVPDPRGATLLAVAQTGAVRWSRQLQVDGEVTTMAVHLDSASVYVGLGLNGTLKTDYATHTDDGVALAYTRSGNPYWSHKVLSAVGAIAQDVDHVYFAGALGDSLLLQAFTPAGETGAQVTGHLAGVRAVTSAAVAGGAVHLAGIADDPDGTSVFTVRVGATFGAPVVTPVSDPDVFVELVPWGDVLLVHLSVLYEGSWILAGGMPWHHFSDDHLTSAPRVAVGGESGCMWLLKGGAYSGRLDVDKVPFDVGREEPVAYVLMLDKLDHR